MIYIREESEKSAEDISMILQTDFKFAQKNITKLKKYKSFNNFSINK